MKRYSSIFTLVVLTGFFLFVSQLAIAYAEADSAPDFTLKDMAGNDVSLSSFKGKPVLLNFWATWCPYCRKERAHLNTLYKEYRDKGLIIVSVSTDSSVNDVKIFLKNTPADFIILSDSERKAASLYNIGGYPTSFLINREGIIKNQLLGYQEWTSSSSRQLIDKILK
ncbi:MAG: TlpA family protein disulfide reductase [Nitrospirae bacterium]|nr:TlpA family protein disulfide reductase [Nitrospirota bacterium]